MKRSIKDKNSIFYIIFLRIFNFLKKLKILSSRNTETLQLTLIYSQAFIALFSTTRSYLGKYFSRSFYNLVPFGLTNTYFAKVLYSSSFVKLIGNPVAILFFYYIIMEIVLGPIAQKLKITVLVKYNLLFVFLSQLILSFLINSWYLIFSPSPVLGFEPRKSLKLYFHSILFLIYVTLYIYCYLCAIKRTYPYVGKNVFFGIPQKIFDSIAYWFRLKRKKNF